MRKRKQFFEENAKKAEDLGRQISEESPLGCRDMFAMISSAYLVIFLVTAAIIAGLGFLLIWLINSL